MLMFKRYRAIQMAGTQNLTTRAKIPTKARVLTAPERLSIFDFVFVIASSISTKYRISTRNKKTF